MTETVLQYAERRLRQVVIEAATDYGQKLAEVGQVA